MISCLKALCALLTARFRSNNYFSSLLVRILPMPWFQSVRQRILFAV